MTQRILKMCCVFAVILSSGFVRAADEFSDDLSLDDAFNSAPTPNPMNSIVPNESNSAIPGELQSSAAPSPMNDIVAPENPDLQLTATNAGDEVENANLASVKELHQRENALYGFSVGIMATSQPFAEKFKLEGSSPSKDNPAIFVNDQEFNDHTDNIQNFGAIVRYAIAPFNSLGTDLNISYMRSQNHSSIMVKDGRTSLTEVTTLKGELNFTYAMELAGGLPIYFLGGFGAQKVTGSVVEKLINPMGYGGQVGGGIVIASLINVEVLYSYYVHRISQTIVTEHPANRIDTEAARATNQGLIVRSSYNFDF